MRSSLHSMPARADAPAPRVRPLAALIRLSLLTGCPLGGAAMTHAGELPTLPAVTVSAPTLAATDTRGQQLDMPFANGALGSRSQLDTPFSTTIVNGENLDDRQVTKLGDVFALDASVTDNSNANSAWNSYLTVRGVPLDWQRGFRINGMPYVGYGNTLPYEQLAQVELLKGSAAFMYGFAAPGGAINYVTKKAPAPGQPLLASIDAGYRSAHLWGQHLDLGGRVGPEDRFGYRVNLTHEEGKPANAVGMNRNAASLGLEARITHALTWTFDGIYQDRNAWGQTPTFATYAIQGKQLPGAVTGRGGRFAGPDQHLYTNLQLYTTGLRYALSPDWTLSTRYSFSKQWRNRNESSFQLKDAAGNYDDYRYYGIQGHQFNYVEAMAEGWFRTGPVGHQIVAGVSGQKQRNAYSRGTGRFFLLGTGNLNEPNTNVFYTPDGLVMYRSSDIEQKAAFVSDTMQLTERWALLAGVRYTNFSQHYYHRGGATKSVYSKSGVMSPTAALMFKPDPGTTLYASYVESLEPGTQVSDPSLANFGQQLDPIRSRQYEVGAKTDRDHWTGTVALFRLERGAQYRQGNYMAQDGLEVYQGAELDGYTRLGQWDVKASAMYLHSRYARGAANNGHRVAGAPQLVLAGAVGFRVPFVPGLRLGVDGKYTGSVKLRPANDIALGGYTVFNAGATYHTRLAGRDITLRAVLANLTNKRFWGFQYADYMQPADPRAISLNAKITY